MSTFLTTLSEKSTTYAYNISLPDAPFHRRQKKRATIAIIGQWWHAVISVKISDFESLSCVNYILMFLK